MRRNENRTVSDERVDGTVSPPIVVVVVVVTAVRETRAIRPLPRPRCTKFTSRAAFVANLFARH